MSGRPGRRLPVSIRSGGPASWGLRLAAAAVIGYVLIAVPTGDSYPMMNKFITGFVLMAAAMSLNLLLGYTGQISLGHSAFFGIGAYATGIFVSRWGWSPMWTFPAAFVIAFVVGVLVSLPALRIKGVYLALVTLSLALLFPQLMKWPKLAWLTGGARGLDDAGFPKFTKDNPTYEIFGWNPWGSLRGSNITPFYYWIAFGVVAVTYLVCRGVVKSRAGRALIAIRDNETAAAVMGVNLAVTKGVVFGISAGLCALPGAVSTIRTGNVVPDSPLVTVLGAITFLVIVVIGGAGSLWGPVLGAALYVWVTDLTSDWGTEANIPALLRPLFGWAENPPSQGIFALSLIVIIFVAPFGMLGLFKKWSGRLVAVRPKPVGTVTVEGDPPTPLGEAANT